MEPRPESAKKTILSKDDAKKALELIKHLEKRPEAALFLKPVDYKNLGLFDYPLCIKNPMDMSTVKKKLKNNKYTSSQDFVADLNLVWDNCKIYNQNGSVYST